MDNKELYILHSAIFGKELNEVKEPEIILSMLKEGKNDIIMSLKWDEKRGNDVHDYHNIVLQHINDKGRIVFYNPMGHDPVKAGTIIKGEYMGPERLVEDTGMESFSQNDFLKCFEEREAVCFIANK